MAQEFGGKFSPGGPGKPAPGSHVQASGKPKATVRARLMFFAPLPLLFTGFGQITAGNPGGIIRDFGAFAVLFAAAWVLREGQKAEAAFDARTSAHRPAFPRKIFAALLSGTGVVLAASSASGLVFPLVLGGFAALLHLVAFDVDPLKNKGMEGIDGFANQRVNLAISEAQAYVDAMNRSIGKLKDRHLQKRLDEFAGSARAMFRNLEQDPRDLTAARKYLSVYLMGARDATVKFVDLYQKNPDPGIRSDYETLLDELEKNFSAQRQEMLLDDRTDLDVEIELLRDRLRSEGVNT